MTRIHLHIGLDAPATARLQAVLADKREQLLSKGILFPRAAGARNHTRLFMAVTDPDHVDALRFNRGHADPVRQAALRAELATTLARDIATHQPRAVILSASHLGQSLARRSELERLRDLLAPLGDDIRLHAHVDTPARMLAHHYAAQVMEGRTRPLTLEQGLTTGPWWDAALAEAPAIDPAIDPAKGNFFETETPPFWLDLPRLVQHWEGVFGAGSLTLRRSDTPDIYGEDATEEIRATFDIPETLGRAAPATPAGQPSAAWITRARQLNQMLQRLQEVTGQIVPRPLWQKLIQEISIDGDPIDHASLSAIVKPLDVDLHKLMGSQPGLAGLLPEQPAPRKSRARTVKPLPEADPGQGFRASQYLLAFRARIERAQRVAAREARQEARAAQAPTPSTAPAAPVTQTAPHVDPQSAPQAAPLTGQPSAAPRPAAARGRTPPTPLSDVAARIMPPLAVENFHKLHASPFRPHNRLGMVNEEDLAAAYTPLSPRSLPAGSTGRVIVGCMKNEAPYIAEWIAYHRAIGVDNFLIYTNDCTDGTSEILDRMQQMGLLQHRNNDGWKGNSPQQSALNKALKEPLIRDAEWIIHIDVDEFINVRCGNGTLDDFFERVPDATNVAMTWRLFGHGGVTDLSDGFVIDQFEWCAPRFCPKPHTVWGFKTMFRNMGAYAKLSCHRPNKLRDDLRDQVRWVNGSGQDMTREAAEKGWRNSVKSIGYDLLQLNHYALRSAESFLIKRQRGRALHVDRSIGLNYWIRMDWCDVRDITIKRNTPRMQAEYDAMMRDDTLRALQERGLDWHRAKAAELHEMPEFKELYEQALEVRLTAQERVAYALALDMES
ncbi:glycosyltransferase family 2 protein [Seohaeicola saemankumensis]|uniref:Glycosyltransferase family 2 protein n=1 Tax=Seohaeicola saemankumensis TaxID=481181 RepID=A0ABW3T8U7_9RHOB